MCSHYPYLDLLVATEAQAMISFTATKNLFTCLWLLLVSFMSTNYFHFQDWSHDYYKVQVHTTIGSWLLGYHGKCMYHSLTQARCHCKHDISTLLWIGQAKLILWFPFRHACFRGFHRKFSLFPKFSLIMHVIRPALPSTLCITNQEWWPWFL